MSKWKRYDPNGYEVSSHGDSRFSAFFARLKDGRTIEEAYQLDVKGYRGLGYSLMQAKGRPPFISISREETWRQYFLLWLQWSRENPELIEDLRILSEGRPLTDKFATTDINQAHALSLILVGHDETMFEDPFKSEIPL